MEAYWQNYIIGYSYKTNALPWLISYLNDQGCFAEVVSDDEYKLAGDFKEQWRQVGNAVPAKLAYVLAEEIKKYL